MSCPDELTLALHADGELPAAPARTLEAHLGTCDRCRARLAALVEENAVLTRVLVETPAEAGSTAPLPALPWRRPLFWTALTVLMGLSLRQLGTAASQPAGDLDWWLLLDAAVFLLSHAAIVGQVVTALAILTMGALFAAGARWLLGRSRPASLAGWLVPLLALAPAPWPTASAEAAAFVTRAGREIAVPAGTTIDGTLVAAGELVRIEGTVTGDLIAAARTLDLRGAVEGDVIFAGRDVQLRGVAGGNVYVMAGDLDVLGRVARTLYGLVRTTALGQTARIDRDLNLIGRRVALDGAVGHAAGLVVSTVSATGRVATDLAVVADRVELGPRATIGGRLSARVRDASDVRIDPAVAIGGARDISLAPPGAGLYAEPRVYVWLGAKFFGALALGWLALLLAPQLVQASTAAVARWWRSLGLGIVTLAGVPLLVALVAITLVGLPLALVLLGVYLLGLYASKIAVSAFIGQVLLRRRPTGARESLLALAAGLLAVTLASELPVVGGVVSALVLCLGLGALAAALLETLVLPAARRGR